MIQSYNQYLNKDNFKELLMLSLYEQLTEDEKTHLRRFQVRRSLVNEGIISTLSAKGKQILQKIASTASNIVNFLDNLKTQLGDHLTKVLTESKDKIKQKLREDKNFLLAVKKEITSEYEEDKEPKKEPKKDKKKMGEEIKKMTEETNKQSWASLKTDMDFQDIDIKMCEARLKRGLIQCHICNDWTKTHNHGDNQCDMCSNCCIYHSGMTRAMEEELEEEEISKLHEKHGVKK